VWWTVAALIVEAYCGAHVRSDSSAPHWARVTTGGMVTAALAWSVAPETSPTVASAALSPGSTRSSRTSVGAAPDRVVSSASTPVLGPVHRGAVPPRCTAPVLAFGAWSRVSLSTVVHSPQAPAASRTRTCTRVSRTSGS
jgi:hypothetical protein